MQEYEFNDPDGIPLSAIVNKEHLLHLALEVVSRGVDEEYVDIAVGIVHWYIINDLGKDGQTFTEEEITEKFDNMVTDHIINGMVKKGLLEENLPEEGKEPTFNVTKQGQSVMQKLLGENDGKC